MSEDEFVNPTRKKTIRIRQILRKLKEDKLAASKLNFITKTTLKAQYGRLNHQVDLAMKAYDDDFEKKRNHLRAKLLEDQSCLNFEYIDKAQKYAERLFQEKKRKAEAIAEANKKEHQEIVDDLLRRQQVLNCDELKSKASSDRTKIVSKANQIKMIENQLLKEKEKQIDGMYNDIMVMDCKYDLDNARLRKKVAERVEMDEYLKMQITGREYARCELEALKEEEIEVIKKYNEKLAEGDRLKEERDEMAKEDLKKMQLEQIKLHEELKEKRNSYDKEIDRIIIEELNKEAEQNRQTGKENKMKTVQELAEFQQAWKGLRDVKNYLDEQDMMKINSLKQERLDDIKQLRTFAYHNRSNWSAEAVSCWDAQVKLKEDRKKMAKEANETFKKLEEACRIDIDVAKKRLRIDDAKRNESDILEQMKYKELTQKRENEVRRKLEWDAVQGREEKSVKCGQMNYKTQEVDLPFFSKLIQCKK